MEKLIEIVKFIDNNSTFTLYHCDFFEDTEAYRDEDWIMFSTRENGCVGNEEAGQEDIDEGHRIVKLVNEKFDHSFEIETDEVDEWVHINIKYSL